MLSLRLDDAVPDGESHEACDVLDVEFEHEPAAVGVDARRHGAEARRDLLAGGAFRDELSTSRSRALSRRNGSSACAPRFRAACSSANRPARSEATPKHRSSVSSPSKASSSESNASASAHSR